jgi:AbrB family looped-hinge helix DNA binding protein
MERRRILMPVVKITRNRQVTIPKSLCQELGLDEGDYVEIVRKGDHLVLRSKKLVDKTLPEKKERLFQLLEKVWERTKDVDPAFIEEEVRRAIAEVRAEKKKARQKQKA